MDGFAHTGGVLATAVAGCGFLVLSWGSRRRRSDPGGKAFLVATLAFGVGALGLAAGQVADVIGPTPGGAVAQFVSLNVVPLAWAVFATEFSGYSLRVPARRIVALLVGPTVLAAVGQASLFAIKGSGLATFEAALSFVLVLYTTLLGSVIVAAGGLAVWTTWRAARTSKFVGAGVLVVGIAYWTASLVVASTTTGTAVAIAGGFFLASALGVGALRRWGKLFDGAPAARTVGPSAVVDDVEEPVVVLDMAGRVREYNPAAAATFAASEVDRGVSFSEVVGATLATIDDRDAVELHTTAGHRRFEATVSSLTDRANRPVGTVVVFRDVTDRRTRQQRLEVLHRILRHNLRNEMNAIAGYANLVADGDGDDERHAELIAALADDLLSMGEKARDVERLMREPRLATSPWPLASVVDRVLADAAADCSNASVSAAGDLGTLTSANPVVVEYVLQNLVENGVEHNDSGSPTVEVMVTYESGEEHPLCITVMDDGPGIPEQERETVVEGEQTPLEHGSGLGLWAVAWGVRKLGGELSFEDADAEGTRAVVELPAGVVEEGESSDAAIDAAQATPAGADVSGPK